MHQVFMSEPRHKFHSEEGSNENKWTQNKHHWYKFNKEKNNVIRRNTRLKTLFDSKNDPLFSIICKIQAIANQQI